VAQSGSAPEWGSGPGQNALALFLCWFQSKSLAFTGFPDFPGITGVAV
jgi:hypothetical protein